MQLYLIHDQEKKDTMMAMWKLNFTGGTMKLPDSLVYNELHLICIVHKRTIPFLIKVISWEGPFSWLLDYASRSSFSLLLPSLFKQIWSTYDRQLSIRGDPHLRAMVIFTLTSE